MVKVDAYKRGKNEGRKYARIVFAVQGGQFHGRWASMMVTLQPADDDSVGKTKLAKIFETVTGVSAESGAKMSFADFKRELIAGTFEGIIQEQMNNEKQDDGSWKKVGSGYTEVGKLMRKLDASETDGGTEDVFADAGVDASDDIEQPPADDDIPF
jgi:hypothetical protein